MRGFEAAEVERAEKGPDGDEGGGGDGDAGLDEGPEHGVCAVVEDVGGVDEVGEVFEAD